MNPSGALHSASRRKESERENEREKETESARCAVCRVSKCGDCMFYEWGTNCDLSMSLRTGVKHSRPKKHDPSTCAVLPRGSQLCASDAVVYRHVLTHGMLESPDIVDGTAFADSFRETITAMEFWELKVSYKVQLRFKFGRSLRSRCSVTREPKSRLGTLDCPVRIWFAKPGSPCKKLCASKNTVVDAATNHTMVSDHIQGVSLVRTFSNA